MLTAPRNPLLLGGGLLLLAGSALMLRQWTSIAPPPAVTVLQPVRDAPPALLGVVVALQEIPRGAVVERAALGLLGMDRAPSAEAATVPEDIVGRVALDHIAVGQTVLRSAVSAEPGAGGLGSLVPMERRAVTLRVAEDTGIAYLLRPGDRVDVAVATLDDSQANAPRARSGPPDLSRLVLQDLLVLAVGETLGREPPAAQRGQPAQRTITLAVTPDQVPLLALARGDGGYLLALRNPADRQLAGLGRLDRSDLLGAAPPEPARPAPAPVPRPPARSGPEIIRGAAGATR